MHFGTTIKPYINQVKGAREESVLASLRICPPLEMTCHVRNIPSSLEQYQMPNYCTSGVQQVVQPPISSDQMYHLKVIAGNSLGPANPLATTL